MIEGLRDVTLAGRDTGEALGAYEALLGVPPTLADGHAPRFRLANMDLAVAPGAADRLHGLTFTVKGLDHAERLLANRGVATAAFASADEAAFGSAGAEPGPRRIIDAAASHGVHVALVEAPPRDTVVWAQPSLDAPGTIVGLDHVVLRTPAPERALAFYGARLGLSLRFDQTYADWGSRIMLFRCGDLIVEVVHDVKKGVSEGPDDLWGFSWRTSDIEAARIRLAGAGFAVSELRSGRRPGSQVFTVRDGTLGIPTIVIGGEG
ncbi:VOC family protein [Chelatococcus reniformis]|uniref:Glyoxalase n=1 Tax=Chelatococcus reniformis TaxID=1494448 RepID=A0A916UBJ5_9HYPH|nr:VOC family protein [Chelatococcus reniformis]GGC66215.1 glyoxalase [Chelatococcus reniformis]